MTEAYKDRYQTQESRCRWRQSPHYDYIHIHMAYLSCLNPFVTFQAFYDVVVIGIVPGQFISRAINLKKTFSNRDGSHSTCKRNSTWERAKLYGNFSNVHCSHNNNLLCYFDNEFTDVDCWSGGLTTQFGILASSKFLSLLVLMNCRHANKKKLENLKKPSKSTWKGSKHFKLNWTRFLSHSQ